MTKNLTLLPMKYEYCSYNASKVIMPEQMNEMIEEFNKLGKEGWELCAYHGGFLFVFRRVLPISSPNL